MWHLHEDEHAPLALRYLLIQRRMVNEMISAVGGFRLQNPHEEVTTVATRPEIQPTTLFPELNQKIFSLHVKFQIPFIKTYIYDFTVNQCNSRKTGVM